MVICTEAIETLSNSSARFQNAESSSATFATKYKNRNDQFQTLSLHQYFMKEKKHRCWKENNEGSCSTLCWRIWSTEICSDSKLCKGNIKLALPMEQDKSFAIR